MVDLKQGAPRRKLYDDGRFALAVREGRRSVAGAGDRDDSVWGVDDDYEPLSARGQKPGPAVGVEEPCKWLGVEDECFDVLVGDRALSRVFDKHNVRCGDEVDLVGEGRFGV